MRSMISHVCHRYHKINTASVFISSIRIIFIFDFPEKYLSGKKLCHFENPCVIFFETMFFFEMGFSFTNPSQKIYFIFSTRVSDTGAQKTNLSLGLRCSRHSLGQPGRSLWESSSERAWDSLSVDQHDE